MDYECIDVLKYKKPVQSTLKEMLLNKVSAFLEGWGSLLLFSAKVFGELRMC